MFKTYQRLWRIVAFTILSIVIVTTSFSFISTSTSVAADSSCIVLGEWQNGAPAPAFHIEGASAVVDGKLFIISGFKDNSLRASKRVDVYNPATDIWETETTPRRETPLETSHIVAAVDGKWIWIAAGFKGNHPSGSTKEVWKYDTEKDLWYGGPKLPESRAAGAFTKVGRKLHYAGGANWDRQTNFSDHWTLNLDNPSEGWQRAPDLPEARIHVSGIEAGGILYAIGGQFGHDFNPVDVSFVHAFDPSTNSWSRKADLPIARSHFEQGTVVIDGKIVIVGGRQNQQGLGQTDDVTVYDPQTGQWQELRPLPTPLIAPVAAFMGDKLIVTNGGYGWNIGSKETFISQVSIVPCTTQPTPASTLTPDATPISTEIPAAALAILAPQQGETVYTSAYPFQWSQIQGITQYRLTIKSTDKTFGFKQDFTDAVCSNGVCSSSLNMNGVKFPNNTTLKIRVDVPLSNGITKGAWYTFNTEMPGKAALIQPTNGGSLDGNQPLLIWQAIPFAQSYRVKIKNIDTGEKLFKQILSLDADSLIQCDNSACLLDLSTFNLDIRVGGIYQWSVVTISADGKSKSDKWIFTLKPKDQTRTLDEILPLP